MAIALRDVLERPTIDYQPDGALQPVARLVWRPVPAPPLPPGVPGRLRGRRVAVVGGTTTSAGRLLAALAAQGAEGLRFDPPDGDLEASAAAFVASAGAVDGIVDLNVETPFGLEASRVWEPHLRRSVALLKAVYGDWAVEGDATRLFYLAVTRMGGLMGYDGAGLPQPLGGIWGGLAKTLPQELPNCNVRVLDVAPQDDARLDELVVRELYHSGLFEIGYRDGARYTLGAQQAAGAPPELDLGPDDTILVSGGARGIGLEIARALAGDHGCRVIVTGRSPLPAGDEPWLAMDDVTFKRFGDALYREAGPGQSVAAVRRELAQIKRQRDLHRHMAQVAAAGLPIEYRPCDFTSAAQVRALVESVGPCLTGVIHNAGIDAPVRLPGKSLDAFVATVSTKVDGFVNIVRALGDRRLKFLCNVGSLTGRWGGMTGETGYAAANEALTRLGLWAAGRLDATVKTLCWPTWDRVGMISNFDVAVQYTSAMHLREGVYLWQRELLSGGSGEVTFMGPVGRSVTPSRLHGFPPIADLANISQLYSQYHYLGEVSHFEPFRRLRTTSRIRTAFAPCIHDVLVDGAPSLPVSVLLEYGLRAGRWLTPDARTTLHLHEVRDVAVHRAALKAASSSYVLEREAAGRWEGGDWLVDVELARLAGSGRQPVGRLRLVYRREPPGDDGAAERAAAAEPGADGAAAEWEPAPSADWSWSGLLFRPARWWGCEGGRLVGEARPSEAADLWTTPYAPETILPSNHLENALRAGLALRREGAEATELEIARLRLFDRGAPPGRLLGHRTGTTWSVVDADGRTCLTLDGVEYR